jgi:hypothetical protein
LLSLRHVPANNSQFGMWCFVHVRKVGAVEQIDHAMIRFSTETPYDGKTQVEAST